MLVTPYLLKNLLIESPDTVAHLVECVSCVLRMWQEGHIKSFLTFGVRNMMELICLE